MQKSQLINILKTFTKKEIRDCRKWLQSPAHNQREDVIVLFEYLMEDGQLDNENALDKCVVFSVIFPNEDYDDARMRQVMYFLSKSVDEFLIYQELSSEEVHLKTLLARVYRKRKLEKEFSKTMRQIEKIQLEMSVRNENYYLNEYAIQQEKYLNVKQRTVEMNLQEVSNCLDTSYLAGKLRQSCLMLSHQKVYKAANYDFTLLPEVLKYVESSNSLQIPVIAIYYYILRMTTEEEGDQYFKELKNQIFQHINLFPQEEARDIYLLAINYCIKQINSGLRTYLREAFDLYKGGIEDKSFLENDTLNPYTFRNIALNGLMLKEYDWVENFILTYQTYLNENYREGFTNFCLARLYFEKGTYNKALELLVQFDYYDDILLTLSGKNMLMKIYYELDEVDALESLLESTRTYIQRKKVIGYHKTNYKNIIRFTKKLIRVNPYESSEKDKLQKEIAEANPLTEKQWLLEQLEKL